MYMYFKLLFPLGCVCGGGGELHAITEGSAKMFIHSFRLYMDAKKN